MYIIKTLFVHPILQSSQTVSDSTVCLCKFHERLTNYLIFNAQAILQRGRILMQDQPIRTVKTLGNQKEVEIKYFYLLYFCILFSFKTDLFFSVFIV